MNFLNAAMLAGVAAVLAPVLIHLLANRKPKRIEWGAWMFLDATVKRRRKRMMLEEVLLLVLRCLLPAAAALALARPFIEGGSAPGWWVAPSLILSGAVALGSAFALWTLPRLRLALAVAGAAMLAGAAVWIWRNPDSASAGGGEPKDIALIVDGSGSMLVSTDGKSNFDRAKDAARKYVETAPRGSAFSLIVAGSAPEVVHPSPVRDRREVEGAILRMRPAGGTMDAAPALAAAAAALSAGRNTEKLVVIVGDGQATGWDFGNAERWRNLSRMFAHFDRVPKIVWRTLPLPASVRNLSIGPVRTLRETVGADREASLKVALVNSGGEPVTPKAVRLEVEGRTYEAKNVRQLQPGESCEYEFKHRFRQPGGVVAAAQVDVDDDIAADDRVQSVISVAAPRKLLIVDGEAALGKFQRSATYLALALRPDFAPLIASRKEREQYAAEYAGRRGASGYPVETEVEEADATARRRSFAGYAAVALCGVEQLPEETLRLLARFAAAGGGLLVVPGERMDLDKFNGWKFAGAEVLPAEYAAMRFAADGRPFLLDPQSFGGKVFSGNAGGDVAALEICRRRGTALRAGAEPAAKFADGETAVAAHAFGAGFVAAAAFGFDPATSPLALRNSFVPLMHSLADWLARRSAVNLDLPPSSGCELLLAAGSSAGVLLDEEGVTGYYYPAAKFEGEFFVRHDRHLRFWWGKNPPMPSIPQLPFAVRWFGELVPPASGRYEFEFSAAGTVTMAIDGREGDVFELEAGRRYGLRVDYVSRADNSVCAFAWKRPDGTKEHVPSACLRAKFAGARGSGAKLAVADPLGGRFDGELFQDGEGLKLAIDRNLFPGVYTVFVPETLRETLDKIVDPSGKFAFSVSTGMAEADLTPARGEDLAAVEGYLPVQTALNDDDVARALKGASFGREVWRWLAWMALALLLLETLLCRWIAKVRRTGETIDAGFGGKINFGGGGR